MDVWNVKGARVLIVRWSRAWSSRAWPMIVLACAFVLGAARPASAQRDPKVSAFFESGIVKLGGSVRLLVQVEDAKSAEIVALPSVAGLRFGGIGTPSENSSFQIVNGRQYSQHSLTWSITVQPLAKGEFKIPPFSVRANGKEFTTREIPLKVVEDLQGDELGVFEIRGPSEVFEGQPFALEMRFGFDVSLKDRLNHYNLSLPWLGELGGLVELDAPSLSADKVAGKIYLNANSVVEVEGVGQDRIGNSTFLILRLVRRFVATRSGKLAFPTSHFEFGSRDTSFFGRSATGTTYYKRCQPLEIAVNAVPEVGRPFEFSGAVGSIAAEASADRRDVDAGDSIKLSVEWSGEGNLEFFDPPDLARLETFNGFRVFGSTDRKTFDRRKVTYDIAPLSPEQKEIPAVSLSYFDTKSKRYAVASTNPITIRVLPMKAGATLAAEAEGPSLGFDLRDLQTVALPSEAATRPSKMLLPVVLLGFPLAWLGLRAGVRRRGDPDHPRQRARRAALKGLRRDLARSQGADAQARALRAFLAARTAETPEAWEGRDVRAYARARAEAETPLALADEDVQALERLLADLDRSRFAGRDEALEPRAIVSVAERLVKAEV